MDLDQKLITAVIRGKSLRDAIDAGLTKELLSERVRPIWSWMHRHYVDYGEAPGEDALLLAHPNYELDDAAPTEGAAYWVDQLRRRFVFNQSRDAMASVASALKEDRPEDAVEAMRKVVTACDDVAVKSSDIAWSAGLSERVKLYEEAKESGGVTGIHLPFEQLTAITGGVHAGEFVVIVAPQGVGKTWFELSMAYRAWREGQRPIIFTHEMTVEQMTRRLDALHFRLPYERFRFGRLDSFDEVRYRLEAEKAAAEEFASELVVIDDPGGGVGRVAAKAERYRATIVYIDGFYLMDDDRGATSGWEKVANVSRDLKSLAKRTGIPIVATAQLAADGQLAYFKGIERDADLVLQLAQTPDQRQHRRMTCTIRKQREGNLTSVELLWDLDSMEFRELTTDELADVLPDGLGSEY